MTTEYDRDQREAEHAHGKAAIDQIQVPSGDGTCPGRRRHAPIQADGRPRGYASAAERPEPGEPNNVASRTRPGIEDPAYPDASQGQHELTLLVRRSLKDPENAISQDRVSSELPTRSSPSPATPGRCAQAERLGLDASTVSRQVAALVESGLLQREPDPMTDVPTGSSRQPTGTMHCRVRGPQRDACSQRRRADRVRHIESLLLRVSLASGTSDVVPISGSRVFGRCHGLVPRGGIDRRELVGLL